jgi:hypothetical protein
MLSAAIPFAAQSHQILDIGTENQRLPDPSSPNFTASQSGRSDDWPRDEAVDRLLTAYAASGK